MRTIEAAARMCIDTGPDSRLVIAAIEADGWVRVGQKGSHVQFKHPGRPGRVSVPHPKGDMPLGTLRSIEKQSSLKLR